MNEPIMGSRAAKALLTIILAIATAIVAIWFLTGIYTIKPGQAAAIRIFGAANVEPVTTEGFHWNWPGPVGHTDIVQLSENRSAEVGFNNLPDDKIDGLTGEGWQRDINAATMITGDLNLVEVQIVAQYRISDLNKYLFHADDPGHSFEYLDNERSKTHRSHPRNRPDGQSLKDTLEIAMRRAFGQRTIDEALITDRETIEREIMQVAQEILDEYETGILLTSVQLQEVKAPDAVQEAFDDVLRAREEKETRINEALAFESDTLPKARGLAKQLVQQAQAYRAERIAAATAEADRFTNILNEYKASPEIIASRMYLETIDRVLPRLHQIIVTGDDPPSVILDAGSNTGRRIITTP